VKNRRLRSGYSNLGPIQIPPRAAAFVLTDRDDGTLYLVSFNTDTVERLSINTNYASIQRREGVRIYEADDGPYMDEDHEYRIFVRAGRIGLEYTPSERAISDIDQAPPYARKTNDEEEIILDQEDVDPLLIHIGLETDG
jgi:hypothetical protein